jgi:hypothetical protein
MVEVLRGTSLPLGRDRNDGLADEPQGEVEKKAPAIVPVAKGLLAFVDSRENAGQKVRNYLRELALILELALALTWFDRFSGFQSSRGEGLLRKSGAGGLELSGLLGFWAGRFCRALQLQGKRTGYVARGILPVLTSRHILQGFPIAPFGELFQRLP